MVIAKRRLQTDAAAFPEALRMVLFADELKAFRAHAIASLDGAASEAKRLLSETEPYALMATFEAARREGSYETDNAIRMADSSARRELNRRLRDETFIRKTLSRLRDGTSVQLYLDGAPEPANLASIVWHERFDDKEHLASLCLPIEIGDIFRLFDLLSSEKTAGKPRYYVLLAQACDLSIREDGKRSNDLQTLVLTRLSPATKDADGKYRLKENQGDLGAFEEGSPVPWRVNFAQQIHVPALALDACVLNSEGQSIIGPSTAIPVAVSLSWVRHAERMRDEAGKMIEQMKRLSSSVSSIKGKEADAGDVLLHLGASIAGANAKYGSGLTARINVENETVEYGMERTARLSGSAAVGLFTLSAFHHARPAVDGNLFPELE